MKAKKLYEQVKNKEVKEQNIIDIREKYEFKDGNIKGSKNIPMNTLIKDPSKYLKKDQIYYIICQTGGRSLSTWVSLKLKKYKVKNVSGGYTMWKEIKNKKI